MHASKPEGPLYVNSMIYLALSMRKVGRPHEAIKVMKDAAQAKGLKPADPFSPDMLRRAEAVAAVAGDVLGNPH